MQTHWISAIQRWIFPEICCFCEEKTNSPEPVCDACAKMLPWMQDACYYCGRHLETQIEHLRCSACEQNLPNFDRLCALFRYEPPLTKLITRLKFNSQFQNAHILGKWFCEKLPSWYKNEPLPQALIPVPMHLKRLRQRGYNQALELMKSIAQYSKIQPLANSCQRIKLVRSQSTLNREQRRRNLSGVFQISQNLNFEHVAIVDDVVTTASTVTALSIALKKAGVKRVDIFCACRA